ncbi:hypothetical protein [Halalkaliarchaeum desulfuricum]|uniref:hypothetical protein n=1 Tax=Halalkaliarchaeum desulfuricum TaxID=2055893 RepID=UPI000E6C9D3B|nr:hypothetical protein [Halalkaliarchaeum desulfuricum]
MHDRRRLSLLASLLRGRLDERLESDRIYGEHYDDDTDAWRRGDLTTPADEDELLDGYTETAWLRGFVELLDRLDEEAELGGILARHYPASRHLCLRYARFLADEGEQEAAVTVAEYGSTRSRGRIRYRSANFLSIDTRRLTPMPSEKC